MELNDLVDSVDILEYISQYTQFEEKGGEYWALSPLKEEETPSFSVNKEMNRFYDFSSGKGGDIISFIKYHDHCNTRQAVETLKRYIGESGTVLLPKRFELYHIAKKFSPRKSNAKASKSAVLPDDYMDRYRRDMGVLQIWKDEGISEESLDKFQVRYDDFSQRIVYPIRSVEGKIINVSGRTIDPEWKEKRQRKYTYFKPLGILDTIYGLAENRQEILRQGEIILFEAAARELKRLDAVPLPATQRLRAEMDEFTARRTALQSEYRKAQREEWEYDTLRQNVEALLEKPRETEHQRQRSNELE